MPCPAPYTPFYRYVTIPDDASPLERMLLLKGHSPKATEVLLQYRQQTNLWNITPLCQWILWTSIHLEGKSTDEAPSRDPIKIWPPWDASW